MLSVKAAEQLVPALLPRLLSNLIIADIKNGLIFKPFFCIVKILVITSIYSVIVSKAKYFNPYFALLHLSAVFILAAVTLNICFNILSILIYYLENCFIP